MPRSRSTNKDVETQVSQVTPQCWEQDYAISVCTAGILHNWRVLSAGPLHRLYLSILLISCRSQHSPIYRSQWTSILALNIWSPWSVKFTRSCLRTVTTRHITSHHTKPFCYGVCTRQIRILLIWYCNIYFNFSRGEEKKFLLHVFTDRCVFPTLNKNVTISIGY